MKTYKQREAERVIDLEKEAAIIQRSVEILLQNIQPIWAFSLFNPEFPSLLSIILQTLDQNLRFLRIFVLKMEENLIFDLFVQELYNINLSEFSDIHFPFFPFCC